MESLFVPSQDLYQSRDSPAHKGPHLRHHLNKTAKRRKPSALKELAKYNGVPGMVSLAGGMPFPEYFPFNQVDVTYQTPLSLSEKRQTTSEFEIEKYGSSDKTGIDLAHLLQYSAVEGHPTLLKYIKDLISLAFDPPHEWETLLTCGSTDGLNKILLILAEEGDKVLVEKYTYASFLAAAEPLGFSPIAVEIDDQGMSATHLRATLEDTKAAGTRMPKLIYLVTVGQNPTGTIMGVQRKKDILAIANEFDILIIEDDPYFFLQFTAERVMSHSAQQPEFSSDDDEYGDFEDIPHPLEEQLRGLSTHDEPRDIDLAYCKKYFETLIPSMLKFDTEGRVFRVETFSKVTAPGMRLGSITTSSVFYDALLLLSQSSSQAPSGLSQAFATKLMFNHGIRGWCQWTAGLRSQYQMRRDHMCALLKAEFGKGGLASWAVPDAGMFIWFRVNLALLPCKHMLSHETTKDIMFKLWVKLAEAKVLIVPGWSFAATPAIAEWKTNFFRLTFASSTLEDMDVGVKIMGTVLRDFFDNSA